MKKDKDQQLVIEQLKKIPIVTVVCEKINISTSTYYRWRESDKDFAKAADAAMQSGELYINDLSEAQIVNLIREKSFSAIALWLRSHHSRYANRLEVQGRIEHANARRRPMTPEEKAEYKKFFRMGLPAEDGDSGKKSIEPDEEPAHEKK